MSEALNPHAEEVASTHLMRELRAVALSTVLTAALPRHRVSLRDVAMLTTSRIAIATDFLARRALATGSKQEPRR